MVRTEEDFVDNTVLSECLMSCSHKQDGLDPAIVSHSGRCTVQLEKERRGMRGVKNTGSRRYRG